MIGGWRSGRRNRSQNFRTRRLNSKAEVVEKGKLIPVTQVIGEGSINTENINLYRYLRYIAVMEIEQLVPHLNCKPNEIPLEEILQEVLENVEDDAKYLIETATDSVMFDRDLVNLEVE